VRSITDVICQFKLNWTDQLDGQAIAAACQDPQMSWLQSTLNPIVTVQIFFLQILHGNTACEHLSHLARIPFTAAAYCKARMRLKLPTLYLLFERSVVSRTAVTSSKPPAKAIYLRMLSVGAEREARNKVFGLSETAWYNSRTNPSL
jgi:hypothetical protein